MYCSLSAVATAQNRSIAQQTIVLLKESLGLKTNHQARRKALCEKIRNHNLSPKKVLDVVKILHEDRAR